MDFKSKYAIRNEKCKNIFKSYLFFFIIISIMITKLMKAKQSKIREHTVNPQKIPKYFSRTLIWSARTRAAIFQKDARCKKLNEKVVLLRSHSATQGYGNPWNVILSLNPTARSHLQLFIEEVNAFSFSAQFHEMDFVSFHAACGLQIPITLVSLAQTLGVNVFEAFDALKVLSEKNSILEMPPKSNPKSEHTQRQLQRAKKRFNRAVDQRNSYIQKVMQIIQVQLDSKMMMPRMKVLHLRQFLQQLRQWFEYDASNTSGSEEDDLDTPDHDVDHDAPIRDDIDHEIPIHDALADLDHETPIHDAPADLDHETPIHDDPADFDHEPPRHDDPADFDHEPPRHDTPDYAEMKDIFENLNPNRK